VNKEIVFTTTVMTRQTISLSWWTILGLFAVPCVNRVSPVIRSTETAIVAECAAWNVGTIAVGDLSGIRGDANCGDHGSLDLHG